MGLDIVVAEVDKEGNILPPEDDANAQTDAQPDTCAVPTHHDGNDASLAPLQNSEIPEVREQPHAAEQDAANPQPTA